MPPPAPEIVPEGKVGARVNVLPDSVNVSVPAPNDGASEYVEPASVTAPGVSVPVAKVGPRLYVEPVMVCVRLGWIAIVCALEAASETVKALGSSEDDAVVLRPAAATRPPPTPTEPNWSAQSASSKR